MNTVQILYLNAQSVVNKISELHVLAAETNPDLILITESWCNESICNSYLNINGYELVNELRKDRCDTKNGVGGGLLVFVRLGVTILPHNDDSNFNQFCKFELKTKTDSMYFYLVYRPPNSPPQNTDELMNLISKCEKDCMLIGDFNIPEIDWINNDAPPRYRPLYELLCEKGFDQLVDFPTHNKGNTLDLVLTNRSDKVLSVTDHGKIGKSDHSMLLIKICEILDYKKTENSFYDWNNMDCDTFKDGLDSLDWHAELNNMNTEQAWSHLKDRLNILIEQCVPVKKVKVSNQPPWMNKELLKLIRKKRRLWSKFKHSRLNSDFVAYKDLEKKAKDSVKMAKKKYEKKISLNLNNNNRTFNSYLRGKMSDKVNIGPLCDDTGRLTNDDNDMANILNSYFSSVFTDSNCEANANLCETIDCSSYICSVVINKSTVSKAIKSLKASNSCGPDNISVKLLQNTNNSISDPLAILFRKSLAEGYVPQDWRDAHVVPIFKKGAKSKPSNYRPISLTSVICRLLETILKNNILDHLLDNNLIKSSQHGFLPHKSCTTNLLEFLETATSAVDQGDAMDVLYLDYAKAFDKVPHKKLLAKMEALNISGNVLNWTKSWLTDRRQKVTLNGEKSEWEPVKSGVPQGSVLGPVAFTIFINDLDTAVGQHAKIFKFADDTKITRKVSSEEDQADMQNTINNLTSWAENWGMSFNKTKCKIMHIGRNNPKFDYSMDGHILEKVTEERDIGVIISSDLKPIKHCEAAASKAKIVLGQMSRSFHFRDRHVFKRLYTTYVRPHLEFAVPVWSPATVTEINVLENVQQRAIQMISGLNSSTYEGKLKELGLDTLEERRKRFDMIQVYRVLHKKDRVTETTWFRRTANQHNRTTRQAADMLNLYKSPCTSEMRRNFFSQRVIDQWNNLPIEIRNSASVNQFKNGLKAMSNAGPE